MRSETISGAVAAVYAVVSAVRVAEVVDYVPPPGNVRSPLVIIDRNGMSWDEAETRVPVRVYVAASKHGGVRDAQLVLDEVLDAIEDALADDSAPTSGSTSYIEAADVWVAEVTVIVSRL